jgi:hypothetical protein
MSALLELPEVLVNGILLSWLELVGVGRLDSALCNHVQRANFLSAINDPDFMLHKKIMPVNQSAASLDGFAVWVMKRNIASTVMTITPATACSPGERARYLQLRGENIQEVAIVEDGRIHRDAVLAVFKHLCEYCPEVLVATCLVPLPTAALPYIATGWQKLTQLTLKECRDDDPPTFEGLTSVNILTYQRPVRRSALPAWETFFTACSPKLEQVTVQDDFKTPIYNNIAARCPSLLELNVNTRSITDADLTALAEGCPLLRKLVMQFCEGVSDDGVVAIAQNGNLIELSVEACFVSDECLVFAAEHCPSLTSLNVGWNMNVTDVTFWAVGEHCHALRDLNAYCTSISWQGLEAIAHGCPLLETLSLEQCEWFGEGVQAIAEHCPRLRSLLASDGDTPSAGVLGLAESCPQLEVLSVRGAEVGDAEITALVQGCPVLQDLYVSGTMMTEMGLAAIRDHCAQLRNLAVRAAMFPGGDVDPNFFPTTVTVRVQTGV